MRRTLALSILLLSLPSPALATWSVIAVDRSTGRVVIASATCVDRDDRFLMGVQAVVVPGKGVAACQAAVDGTHQNQMLVFQELQKGTDPNAIIALLSKDPAFQGRQFGILDLQGRGAGHSGLTNGYVSQDMRGQVPGTEIFFSIQGNILRPGEVVPNAVKAFLASTGTITDRVMAAMEAADAAGGDSRCSCTPAGSQAGAAAPQPGASAAPAAAAATAAIPCDGKTSHVAYILAADRQDTSGDSHNNGRYAMYLTVSQPGDTKGPGAIKEGENLNPVKTLRVRYDAWKKTERTAKPVEPGPAPVVSQTAANPQRGAPPPGAPGPQRGGGRGRGAVQVMTMTSTAWADGGRLPVKHTQSGERVSPPLSWSGAPEGTASFVLIAHDADAPTGGSTDGALQWLVWNIPASATGLPEAVAQGPQLADGMRQISATGPHYAAPGAPASGPAHHYVFELFALDTMLEVPAVGATPAQTRAAVMAAMAGHIRGKAAYVGLYKRAE